MNYYDNIREIPMQAILRLLSFTIVLLATSTVSLAEPDSGDASNQKAVLVTGASTGIGRKITEVLAANGYFVYAGARKQKDLDALNEIENVQSIRLDVTIQDGGRGLYGLVNNAGVGGGGPLIEIDEKDVQWMFDVNVFGVFRVTQAFAPMIIEEKGRIVTIGSIAGTLSGPFYGPYAMTKHSIEAYTDALAPEMERFDVQVSVIEPGNYRSEISKSGRARMGAMDAAKEKSPYAEEYKRKMEGSADRSQYKDPDEVAEAALHTRTPNSVTWWCRIVKKQAGPLAEPFRRWCNSTRSKSILSVVTNLSTCLIKRWAPLPVTGNHLMWG